MRSRRAPAITERQVLQTAIVVAGDDPG